MGVLFLCHWNINVVEYFAHETAIIDDGATIGEDSRIWHWVHVCGGAIIGKNVSLGQNVFVADDVLIGCNVKIQNNVSIYDAVTIEDDVFCGPSMVFTNVHNPRSSVIRKGEYRKTIVEKGATLGANCTIVCGNIIGKFSFVGAGAVVTRDVKPYSLVVGVPAKQTGWVSEFGEVLDLPLEGNQTAVCIHTGQKYRLDGKELLKLED